MQTLTSTWDRPPLEVDDPVPTSFLTWWLGNVHVGTSDREVLRECHDRIKRHPNAAWTRELRKQTYRAAIWLHRENQACYRAVMSGRL